MLGKEAEEVDKEVESEDSGAVGGRTRWIWGTHRGTANQVFRGSKEGVRDLTGRRRIRSLRQWQKGALSGEVGFDK